MAQRSRFETFFKIDRWDHANCQQATDVSQSAAVGFVKNSFAFGPVKY